MASLPSVEDSIKKKEQDPVSTQSQIQVPPETNNELQESQTDEKEEKEENASLNPEFFNDDIDESNRMEKLALDIQPYFSNNTFPKSLYLQQSILPIVYEALSQVEKIRPKDPIEFFAVYLLDKNKFDANLKQKKAIAIQE